MPILFTLMLTIKKPTAKSMTNENSLIAAHTFLLSDTEALLALLSEPS